MALHTRSLYNGLRFGVSLPEFTALGLNKGIQVNAKEMEAIFGSRVRGSGLKCWCGIRNMDSKNQGSLLGAPVLVGCLLPILTSQP